MTDEHKHERPPEEQPDEVFNPATPSEFDKEEPLTPEGEPVGSPVEPFPGAAEMRYTEREQSLWRRATALRSGCGSSVLLLLLLLALILVLS